MNLWHHITRMQTKSRKHRIHRHPQLPELIELDPPELLAGKGQEDVEGAEGEHEEDEEGDGALHHGVELGEAAGDAGELDHEEGEEEQREALEKDHVCVNGREGVGVL